MSVRISSICASALALLGACGAAFAGGPWRYSYIPTLGINVAHDMRYYMVPAVYDPERRRLAYFGYPSWGVNTGWGWSGWSPYGWWPSSAWAWPYPNDYAGDPLYEVPRRVQPRPTQPASDQAPSLPAPLTLAELGAHAMRSGEFARAAAIYERLDRERRESEASAPAAPAPDRTALRLMALALAGAGKHAEAQSALAHAEADDPSSSGGAVDACSFVGSREGLRRLVTGAVRFAQSTTPAGAPAAWRYVAALMDFEGRSKQAEAMRRRADELEQRRRAPARALETPSHGPARFWMPSPEAQGPAPARESKEK